MAARILLFLHVAGVALWLGAAWAAWSMVRRGAAANSPDARRLAAETVRSIIRGIINPSALLALFTGIGMMVHMGLMGPGKPFWLSFMEQAGGLTAMATVGFLTWQLRRVSKAETDAEAAESMMKVRPTLSASGLAVLAVVLVVMLRLG